MQGWSTTSTTGGEGGAGGGEDAGLADHQHNSRGGCNKTHTHLITIVTAVRVRAVTRATAACRVATTTHAPQ